MIRSTRILILSAIFTFLFAFSFNEAVLGQGPPPPPPGGGHGQAGNQGSGEQQGAPIGGGLEILIALGALYAGKKFYKVEKEEQE